MTADDRRVDEILSRIAAWALSRPDIFGLAVVGSWARGKARSDSDVDLVFLTSEPERFRADVRWLGEIDWADAQIVAWHDAQYGSVWSRHVRLRPEREIEFTFCGLSWAATNPNDPGTVKVVSGGCRILVDKAEHFTSLIAAINLMAALP